METTTYIIGAGASYNALPLASGFQKKLDDFIKRLEALIGKEIGNPGMPYPEQYRFPPKGNYNTEFYKDIEWLRNISNENETIDTYAKKLTHRNDNNSQQELRRLKNIFTVYLLIEQAISKPDTRYDEFVGSIIQDDNHGIRIRNDVNILSWNYDSQFIKSYHSYCNNHDSVFKLILENNQYYRINGHCDIIQEQYFDLSYKIFTKNYLTNVMALYIDLKNGIVPTRLKFAWEKRLDDEMMKFEYKPKNIVSIGYSFPNFNREIDIQIISKLSKNLERFYVQVPKSDFDSVKNRLDNRLNRALDSELQENKVVEIINIPSCDKFYLTSHI